MQCFLRQRFSQRDRSWLTRYRSQQRLPRRSRLPMYICILLADRLIFIGLRWIEIMCGGEVVSGPLTRVIQGLPMCQRCSAPGIFLPWVNKSLRMCSSLVVPVVLSTRTAQPSPECSRWLTECLRVARPMGLENCISITRSLFRQRNLQERLSSIIRWFSEYMRLPINTKG